MLNPHWNIPPEIMEKNLKVCPHCQGRYYKAQKGNCPNCGKRLTKRPPDKAHASVVPNSIAKYFVVEVDCVVHPPCG